MSDWTKATKPLFDFAVRSVRPPFGELDLVCETFDSGSTLFQKEGQSMSDIAKAAAEYVSKAVVYQALEMSNTYGLSEEQRKAQAARYSQARWDLIQAKTELDKLAGTDEEARAAVRMYLTVSEELSRERNTSDGK